MSRPIMSRPIVVFDLDGTLVDTAPDLLDSLNHCLDIAGLAKAAPEELRRFVGMGGRVMIERAFAAQKQTLTTERLDELLVHFLQHYSNNIPGNSQPFPGAIAALDRLEAAGYIIAVCTNKYEKLSTSLLEALSIDHRFAANCGADTFDFRKPDPRHLTETIKMAGGNVAQAIMVGDSRTDIDTAKAAGIPVIAVDFGYTDRPVEEFSPSRIISHFDELTLEMTEDLIAALAR